MTEVRTIEEAMQTKLTPEDAPRVYALTEVPPEVSSEVCLAGKFGYRFVKRAFDIVSSGLGMLILSPIIAGTAIAVKLTSPGPIIFKQCRVGRGKTLFNIYKFRTMRIDTPDLPSHMIDANEWMTPIGATLRKLSLDELPQMWNIFKGDMSVVGPRPERPEIAKEYEESIPEFAYRLKVKAGLTGYAQIYGKYNTTAYDKLKLDLMYIESYSILEDLKLILATFKIVFTKESTEGLEEGQTISLNAKEEEKKDV